MSLTGALSGSKQNAHAQLRLLDPVADGAALREMAEGLGDQVSVWPFYHDGDWISDWIAAMEAGIADGSFILFAVLTPNGAFAGLTGYIRPDAISRTVEIGMTMYGAAYQGTKINPAAKHLLLHTAFEAGLNRVQLNVDDRNERSKAAVLKLGATYEGTQRENRMLANGFIRSTCVFSILACEWPAVRQRLEARLD